MADKVTISFGIIGLLIVGGLGAYILTPEQLAAASTCNTTNVTAIFEKLSASNATGYWTVNGTQKQAVCTKGKWIPTTEWLKMYNLSAKNITIQPVEESKVTENNVEIVSGYEIRINTTKQLVIKGEVYNITYLKQPSQIKCICDRVSGCKVSECLG